MGGTHCESVGGIELPSTSLLAFSRIRFCPGFNVSIQKSSPGGYYIVSSLFDVSKVNLIMFFLSQLSANVVVFLCVNVVGVFTHNLMEHAQRKAFLDTRNCIAARLEMEDENEKLVREDGFRRIIDGAVSMRLGREMRREILINHRSRPY